MKKTLKLYLASLVAGFGMLLTTTTVRAQVVHINLDKMVIYADSLQMPPSTSLMTVLGILPELLERPGESLISNYDIQVNGMGLGSVSDVALSQLQLVDVEKLEISESPISTYKRNGEGGSINIVLRNQSNTGKNLWGSAGVMATAPLDITPQFTIGYNNKKFRLHGLSLGDIYNYSTTSTTDTYTATGQPWGPTNEKHEDYRLRSCLNRVYMQFFPNSKDEFQVNVSQNTSYANDKNSTWAHANDVSKDENTEKQTTVETQLKYSHTEPRLKTTVEFQYAYTPRVMDFEDVERTYHSDFNNHNLNGKLELKADLLPQSDSQRKLQMSMGVKSNMAFKHEDTRFEDRLTTNYYEPDNTTSFLMPYLRLEGVFGKVRLMAIGELQSFNYKIQLKDSTFRSTSNDFTGQFITEWHVKPNHNLRLILDRKLERPNEEQLYPYLYYSYKRYGYAKGQPSLTPTLSHEISLQYNGAYHWNEHALEVILGASYNKVSDIITAYTNENKTSGGLLGQTLRYTTFQNKGERRIQCANAMLLYTYRFLNLAANACFYNNNLVMDGNHNHNTYYILSLMPSVSLNDGWKASMRFIYYSKYKALKQTISDEAMASLNVGKTFEIGSRYTLYPYVYGRVSLTGKAKDESYQNDDYYKVTTYKMIENAIGAGLKFTF